MSAWSFNTLFQLDRWVQPNSPPKVDLKLAVTPLVSAVYA